jgi:hypothetical protein
VAIETMEAMLARSNPPDVVIPAAHDAIRHSARAAAVARDFAAGRDSGFNFGDDLFDKATGILNAAGRDAVQRMASAIPLWNGPLRIQCSAAAVPIARNALIQAGIPEDRLVFITAP